MIDSICVKMKTCYMSRSMLEYIEYNLIISCFTCTFTINYDLNQLWSII